MFVHITVYLIDKGLSECRYDFLAHLSRRLVGELIVYPCYGVRPSFTISNMNISATSGPSTLKFCQKHHWDGRKAAFGFGPDLIKFSGFHGNR